MEVWPRPPARDRSLYSRQEFQHSIVCFRKIRDGTAKASRAQFTLLNRRNGLEAPDECRLFPRYSAFKFSFRAVLLLFPSSPFLSLSIPLQSIFNSRVRVSSRCPLRFTDFHAADPARIPHKMTPISFSTLDCLAWIFWNSKLYAYYY